MLSTVALMTPHTLSHRTAEETIALGYLASVLRNNGYPVVIVDGWLRGIGPDEITNIIGQTGKPDIICMSCYRSNLEQSQELLHALTERFGSIPSICGGYGPTFHGIDFGPPGSQWQFEAKRNISLFLWLKHLRLVSPRFTYPALRSGMKMDRSSVPSRPLRLTISTSLPSRQGTRSAP